MNKSTRNGLLALAGAAWAYWQFKMTPDQKTQLKSKITDAGKQIAEKVPQSLKEATNRVTEKLNRNQTSSTNHKVDQPAHL